MARLRPWRRLLAPALLLGLAACAGPGGGPSRPQPQTTAEAPVVETLPEPALVGDMPGASEQETVVAALDPERLVGLDGASVLKFLGTPDFQRRDAPAEIWQYRAEACVLDVFLYASDRGPLVRHLEARARSVARISWQDCVQAVVSQTAKRT